MTKRKKLKEISIKIEVASLQGNYDKYGITFDLAIGRIWTKNDDCRSLFSIETSLDGIELIDILFHRFYDADQICERELEKELKEEL